MKKEIKNDQAPEISHEMICSIVSLAATGVNGVERISTRITDEILDKLSLTSTSKGIKISHEPEGLMVGVYIITEPCVDIVKVSKEIQAKIKASVESMTDLQVAQVNVRIESSGI
ncbi:MAG: Asp23/Gls24 family envelope stress response protein [Acetobacterium sp.]